MPTPEQIAAVYDFEHVMEVALKGLFTAQEVKAFTSQMVQRTGDAAQDEALEDNGWDLIDFQKDRPRVEIMFVPGAGQDQWTTKPFTTGQCAVNTSWKGQFKLEIITEADMRIHSAFRNMIRFIVHTQLFGLNGNQLTNHCIQNFFHDGGTSPVIKAEQGIFQTTMLFDIDFSIQDDAWTNLAA